MTANTQNEQDQGVLLTVDACSYSNGMVELAVAIAASVQGHLRGQFIEDEDLMRAASLPFTREISLATAQEHPTDLQRMQRSLRALAAQFKAALQRSAQASNVSWSYDYVSGRREELVVMHPAMAFSISSQAQLRQTDSKPRTRRYRVLLIDDHSPHLVHALQVLLRQFNHDLVELTQIQNKSPANHALSEALAAAGLDPQHLSTAASDRSELQSILATRAHEFDYALLSRNEDADTRLQVMRKLHCPVILVS